MLRFIRSTLSSTVTKTVIKIKNNPQNSNNKIYQTILREKHYYVRGIAGNVDNVNQPIPNNTLDPYSETIFANYDHHRPNQHSYDLIQLVGNGQQHQVVQHKDVSIERYFFEYDINGSCSLKDLIKVFENIKTNIKPDEKVILDLDTHGLKEGLVLADGHILTPDELKSLIDNNIPRKNKVILRVDACYSGVFLSLGDDRTTVYTSSNDLFTSHLDRLQPSAASKSIVNYINADAKVAGGVDTFYFQNNYEKSRGRSYHDDNFIIFTPSKNESGSIDYVEYDRVGHVINKSNLHPRQTDHKLTTKDFDILHNACLTNEPFFRNIPKETADALIATLVQRRHLPQGYNNNLYKHIEGNIYNYYASDSLMAYLNESLHDYVPVDFKSFINQCDANGCDIYHQFQAEDKLFIYHVEKYIEENYNGQPFSAPAIAYLNSVQNELNYIKYKLNEFKFNTNNNFYDLIAKKTELLVTLALHKGDFNKIAEFINKAKLSINPLIEENITNYASCSFFSRHNKQSPLHTVEKVAKSDLHHVDTPNF